MSTDLNVLKEALNYEVQQRQEWCRIARELGRMLLGRVPDNYYQLGPYELLRLAREKTHGRC